ncbi:MAG: hypothetical protein ACMXX7_02465 [Candidatus Woesearchaeota archaeon]
MIEIEKTYLAKEVPKNLKDSKYKEIIDIYIPKNSNHPTLRLRKNGEKYELTKKEPIEEGDSSIQKEQTIFLTKTEFEELSKLQGKKVRKIRYYYKYKENTAEIDVFKDELEGLIVIDFEFETKEQKENFEIPNFCLADITQEEFIAGGMICGKKYEDIQENLEKYGYKKIYVK